jgi:nucleoporin NUP159
VLIILVSGIFWLSLTEFLLVYSPPDSSSEEDALYSVVNCDKEFKTFSFQSSSYPLLFPAMDGPSRKPPVRYSIARLQAWKPAISDMLILTGANSADITVLTKTAEKIAGDQENVNEFQRAGLLDSRVASVPRMSLGEDGESVLIGEALDLSSKDNVERPVPALGDEILESPTPLPAYMTLTHEGILAAWWIVYDHSIQDGTSAPGLTHLEQNNTSTTPAKAAPQVSNPFKQPTATFGTTTPQFGASGFGTTTPAPEKPSQPAFGAVGFGTTAPAPGKSSQPSFGAAGFGTTAPGFAKPAFGQTSVPAFGAASQPGTAAGFGNTQSPWSTQSKTPFSQTPNTSFSSKSGEPSGFSKFSTPAPAGGSAGSSFGSASGGQSGFSGLGQQNSLFSGAGQQKSPFMGLGQKTSSFSGGPGGFKGLSTESSFGGSSVTIPSGTGSSLSSWAVTPASQASKFGQGTSSFGSNKESENSDASDAENREREEATPTPQLPPAQTKGTPGFGSNGFKLGTTFRSDGSSNDNSGNPAPSSAGSLFGKDFSSTLPPATPNKPQQGNGLFGASTTPATQAKPSNPFLPAAIPFKETSTPKAAPPEKAVMPEDAPLPPDPMTFKPAKTNDDLPPLAGSPPIKLEAPDSSGSSGSPSDDGDDSYDDGEQDDTFEVEEEEEGDSDDAQEPSPSDTARRPQPGFNLQQSVNQSPPKFPAAPTPPPTRSAASGQAASGQQPNTLTHPFSQPFNPSPLGFGQSAATTQPTATGGALKQPPSLPPPNRPMRPMRSSSPVRAASTSALGGEVRRQPMVAPEASLSASVRQSSPPTPQPQVSDLTDEEDERIRRELASDIEPSRTLDRFLARQEYNGTSAGKTGHAAQIEIVYRDINNMVDTLGLNWRSVKAFMDYHEQPQRDTEVDRETLEEILEQGEDGPWFETWCLAEIDDLQELENELETELDEGRVRDVNEKLSQLARLLRDWARLETRVNEFRRDTVINRKDPEKVEGRRKAALPKELADRQKALRSDYAQLLTQLSRAEEEVFLLKSRLASRHAENGKMAAVPTVDAVKGTIAKLINVTERKNNDITLLESRLRKVGLEDSGRPTSSSSRQPGTPRRSRRARDAESPFATPPTAASRMSLSQLSRKVLTPEVEATPTKGGYGFFYTPEGTPTSGRDLVKLGDVVEENLDGLRETSKRRRNIAKGLASALVERGVKQTRVN